MRRRHATPPCPEAQLHALTGRDAGQLATVDAILTDPAVQPTGTDLTRRQPVQ